jgi:hypothetical protein
MSQCDLACSAETAQSSQPDYELLAYTAGEASDIPLLVPRTNRAAPFEIIAPVRLVHDGSGFIAEGAISTDHSTRFSVPYPGRWEVFLSGQLRFITPAAVDISGTNLAQLQADLTMTPVSMGVLEANTGQTQMVNCPINCVIETPPPAVAGPHFLPETGAGYLARPATRFLFFIGLSLLVAGGALFFARRAQ